MGVVMEPKLKRKDGLLNLREASLKLGQRDNFLAYQRSEKNWPSGIKLTRKRMALYMPETQLDVLRKYYGIEKSDGGVLTL